MIGIFFMTHSTTLYGTYGHLNYTMPYENEGKGINAMDSINKIRLKSSLVIVGSAYAGTSYLLYQSWYKNYERSAFHFHNDWGQWRGMDKIGHLYSSYHQSELGFGVAKWVGLNDSQAITWAAASSFVFQTTIEVFDGFSKNWGFSFSDYLANLGGIGLFSIQEAMLKDQPVRLKFSSALRSTNQIYHDGSFYHMPELVDDDFFGESFAEKLLKDYNSQKYWLSINMKSVFPKSKVPSWLNIAVGYGIENDFGTHDINGEQSSVNYKKHSQFYLSLDTDLSKIRTQSPFLNTLLDILNVLKTPFSSISLTTDGQLKFHIFSW